MSKALSFVDANAYCHDEFHGSHLVVIGSHQENQFLRKYKKSHYKKDNFWIGLKENGNPNEYVWVDGSTLDFGRELARDPWGLNGQNSVRLIVYSIKQVY